MKSIINIFNRVVLMLIFVTTITVMNSSYAQTSDEEDVIEKESDFFGDGLNSEKFNSNYSDDYQYKGIEHEYHAPQRQEQIQQEDVRKLNLDVDRHVGSNGTVVYGGGSNVNPLNDAGKSSTQGVEIVSVNPPVKKDGPGSFVPDNEGDPDVPVDGGILGLALSGIAWGAFKKRKK